MNETAFIATAAQKQYFNRPADERFDSLEKLQAAVHARALISRETVLKNKQFQIVSKDDTLFIDGDILPAIPTHWSFGQLSQKIGAPAAYLRKLPSDLAADCLNYSIQKAPEEQVKFMTLAGDETLTAQAVTSQNYGRIWDRDVVDMTKKAIDEMGGVFYPPKNWNKQTDGLYASDRDCFMFFIDGGSIVDGGGERDQLHRGVYVWNSEVGAQTFGLATFLFRTVCGNLCIGGIEDAKMLKIKHTRFAPDRFLGEGVAMLKEFSNTSVKQIEGRVKAAKLFNMPTDVEDKIVFLMKKGFTRSEAKNGLECAEREEGNSGSLWNVLNGLTAYARSFAHTDARVNIQSRAGKLLELVAA